MYPLTTRVKPFRHVLLLSILVIGVYLPTVHARGVPQGRGSAGPSETLTRRTNGVSRLAPVGLDQVYPRLANYNGLQEPWQVPFVSSDDLVVARRDAPVLPLLHVHPHGLALLYERTLQADLAAMPALYGLNASDVPAGWWLVQAGDQLAAPIDATQSYIQVVDPRPFAACQDVLVDGESMHVWAVQGHMLYVARGYYSAPTAHAAGTRVAPHASYRTDLTNCHLSGPTSDPRPWSFNLASTCPRYHGQTWADFLAHRVADLARQGGWRGVFYDNLNDLPPTPLTDVNGDGRADGGVIGGVDVWRAGARAMLAETRRLLPGAPLLVNGDLVIDGVADGREMEAFPIIPGAALSAGIDTYLYDTESGRTHTIVNADTNAHPAPVPSAAQLAVGVSLLGSGYAAYDYGWLDHGYPWWFDAYDGGAGSATTAPVDAATGFIPLAHPARFRPGDIVLLDAEAVEVVRVVSGGLVAWRGVQGTLSAAHAARTAATTSAQRAAGHGYLGRPLGPARLVPTADWSRAALPVALARGSATVDGRVQRAALQPLTPRSEVRAFSSGHYAPDAAGLTLRLPARPAEVRTLVFTARGPAGQALWVYAGRTGVPLILRSSWRRYVIPIGGTGSVSLGMGRARGHINITGVRALRGQAFVWRRDFARGAVLVNSTDVTQLATIGHAYHLLAGDQDPARHQPVGGVVTIAPYSAAILLLGR